MHLLYKSFKDIFLQKISWLHDNLNSENSNSWKTHLRDHISKSEVYLKKLKNRFVGLVNVYKLFFFIICKVLNINKMIKINFILKLILAISQKIVKILQKKMASRY